MTELSGNRRGALRKCLPPNSLDFTLPALSVPPFPRWFALRPSNLVCRHWRSTRFANVGYPLNHCYYRFEIHRLSFPSLHLSNSRTPSTFVQYLHVSIFFKENFLTRILYFIFSLFDEFFIPWTCLFFGFFFVYVRNWFRYRCFVGLGFQLLWFIWMPVFRWTSFVSNNSKNLDIHSFIHSIDLLCFLIFSLDFRCKRILQQLSWIQQVFKNNSSIANFVRILLFDLFDLFDYYSVRFNSSIVNFVRILLFDFYSIIIRFDSIQFIIFHRFNTTQHT